MASPFLESLIADIRLRGYSLKTEKSYLEWIRKYIPFIGERHPSEAGPAEVKAFLTHLAVNRNVAINTQKVALNAVVFLYHKFFNRELGDFGFKLATKQRHLPSVLSVREVGLILAQLSGRNRFIIELPYGSFLRVNECLRLRVQDVDLDRLCLTIRDGKGHKYPSAFRLPAWAFLFPSSALCAHPYDGTLCRHHLHDSVVRRFLAVAVREAGTSSPLDRLGLL